MKRRRQDQEGVPQVQRIPHKTMLYSTNIHSNVEGWKLFTRVPGVCAPSTPTFTSLEYRVLNPRGMRVLPSNILDPLMCGTDVDALLDSSGRIAIPTPTVTTLLVLVDDNKLPNQFQSFITDYFE